MFKSIIAFFFSRDGVNQHFSSRKLLYRCSVSKRLSGPPKAPMNRYRDIFAAGLYLNHAFEDARNAPSTFIQWSADGRAEMTLGTQGIDLEIFQESTVVIHTEVLKCAPYS